MPQSEDTEPPVEFVAFGRIDPVLWRPVGAGMWKQHELWDGTYDMGDLFDVLDFLDVRDENRRRMEEWMARKNELSGRIPG